MHLLPPACEDARAPCRAAVQRGGLQQYPLARPAKISSTKRGRIISFGIQLTRWRKFWRTRGSKNSSPGCTSSKTRLSSEASGAENEQSTPIADFKTFQDVRMGSEGTGFHLKTDTQPDRDKSRSSSTLESEPT